MQIPVRRLFVMALSLGAAACSSSDDSTQDRFIGASLTTYVAFERGNGIASIARGDRTFESRFFLLNEGEGGLALDLFGNAYQADIRLGSAVQVLWRLRARSSNEGSDVFTVALDREISGATTTLLEPRDVALAHRAGLVFVTDTGDGAIKVWGSAAGGDVPPLFMTTPAAPAWDVAYDEGADRLFAALTDGTIAVFDDFVSTRPAAAARTIVPTFNGGAAASSSLRGIAYVNANGADRLVALDVGPTEGSAPDGAILQIGDASTADGPTPVLDIIFGDGALADPTDLAVAADGSLRVVDAGMNRAYTFPPGFVPGGLSLAPSYSVPSVSSVISLPRGVAIEPKNPAIGLPSVSDLDDPATAVVELVASVAPAGMNGSVLRLPADLSGPATATFDVARPASGITVDALGDVYVGYSDGVEGGLAVLGRLAIARGTGADVAFDPARDRLLGIQGGPFSPAVPPVAPSGVDIDEEEGVVIVADPGLPGVWLFGRTAGSMSTETVLLQDGYSAGGGRPTDVDYDAERDRLYVSVSSGVVYVYDAFLSSPGTIPDRIVTPSDALGGVQLGVNLTAIVHDAQRDLLILAESGADAGASNNGAIYVIEGASNASGLTPPLAIIAGTSTLLDEPLDMAWNGSTLWIAEHQNGQLLRYDDLLTLSGEVAATAALALPDVRSVQLVLPGLAPASGGSIDVD